jgi:hypothetical protein
MPGTRAAKDKHLRVIDESGEDYLYPADFVTLTFHGEVERALSAPVTLKRNCIHYHSTAEGNTQRREPARFLFSGSDGLS